MQEKNKEIRFIDSDYNELFRIKDGEYITVTTPNGVTESRCKYIDEYHMQIGYNTFHICEFAEIMERSGSTYRPKDTPSYTLEKVEQSEFAYMFRPTDETQDRDCICYIRGYFDNSIDERFQASAMIENKENYQKFHTDDFRRECDNIINYFRFQSDTPILKSRIRMHNAAYDTKAERYAADKEIFGYRVTTEQNVYYFRCDPRQGQYNLYCYCYDRPTLEKHKDLQFVEQHYAEINKDKFFLNENSITEMYYNPDSNEGGQFVELTIYKEDIEEAAKLYKNPKDFFSHLESLAKGSLHDVGTETFRGTAEYFMERKADFEGCSQKTMQGLKKYAGIESQKSPKKTEPER